MSFRGLRGLGFAGCAIAGLLGVTACQEPRADTAIVLDILTAASAGDTVPEYIELDWYDGSQGIFRSRRVPASGALRPEPPYASIVLEISSTGTGASLVRRAVVRGYVGLDAVLFGAGRFGVRPGRYDAHAVRLAPGRPSDVDNDGMPNEFDVCAQADDFEGCEVEPVDAAAPDAPAARPDGGVDAAADVAARF